MPAPISTKRANALLSFRLASVAGSTMPLNEMSRVKDIDRSGAAEWSVLSGSPSVSASLTTALSSLDALYL